MARIYTFDQALEIVSQLVKLLHQAHIGERSDFDVTPGSVMVEMDGEGRPVVRLRDVEFEDGRPPELLEIWRYRAPERWWGARKSSVTDQYALAALFVELVTGKAPFAGVFATNDLNVVKTVLANRPADLPADCPRRDVLLRALAKDPRARYGSCSEFAAELADPSSSTAGAVKSGHGSHHHHHHGHGHSGHSGEGQVRHRSSKGKLVFALIVIGAAIAWAVQSGNLDRWLAQLKDLDGSQAKQRAEMQQKLEAQQEEKRAAAKREHAEQVAEIRASVQRQTEVVDRVRKELREFMATGDASYMTVRLEAMKERQRKNAENLAKCESETEAARTLVQNLESFAQLGASAAGVSKVIPQESEVNAAYKVLADEGRRLGLMRSQLTDKHPNVIAQIKVFEQALARFKTALEGSLKHARTSLEVKEGSLFALQQRMQKETAEYQKLEHDVEVAKVRRAELEARETAESDRLTELRRREVAIEFGASAPK